MPNLVWSKNGSHGFIDFLFFDEQSVNVEDEIAQISLKLECRKRKIILKQKKRYILCPANAVIKIS